MNKKSLTFMLVAAISAPFLFSNCASIVSKATYPVVISSNPPGADVRIINKYGMEIYRGTTPTSVPLKSSAGFFSYAEYRITFSKAGYTDKTVFIRAEIDGWYFGNILFGGLIGLLIVDPATGAMWTIGTEYVNETLDEAKTSSDRELKIMNLTDIPAGLKPHLVRID
jgi:hypothetical protein